MLLSTVMSAARLRCWCSASVVGGAKCKEVFSVAVSLGCNGVVVGTCVGGGTMRGGGGTIFGVRVLCSNIDGGCNT
eukprot:6491654-Amphidinium_carterae.3